MWAENVVASMHTLYGLYGLHRYEFAFVQFVRTIPESQ
jgi:hypothetical protein